DRPASMFVADFVGSPPMNFIRLDTAPRRGDDVIAIDGATIKVPQLREDPPAGDLVLGARPEHVAVSDASSVRGAVFAVEYLGTTQIVTVRSAGGTLKARLSSAARLHAGENVGLTFRSSMLSLFDPASGRAIRTALHEGQAGIGGPHG